MRHIGTLPNETQARVFGDFLFARGIPNEIEADEGTWVVWVKEEGHFGEAERWLGKFRAQPDAAEFKTATSDAAKARAAEAKELVAFHRRVRGSKSLWPSFGGYGAGLLTYALIIICIIVAFYSKLGDNHEFLRPLFISDPDANKAGFLPEIFREGQVWRLFTPMFIHFGLLHIFFNMMWLYNLGSMVEARQGWKTLLLFVACSQVILGIVQYWFAGPEFGGMSGVVYALVGYVWMRGKYDRGSGVFLDRTNLMLSLVWLVLCFTGALGPIANFAHLAGLIAGMAWGRISAHFATRRPE